MRDFMRRWRERWTPFDTIMAALVAAEFVTSVELTVLKLWF